MNLNAFEQISYRLFRKKVSLNPGEYLQLQKELAQAHIGVPFDIYISMAFFLSVLLSLPLGILGYILMEEEFIILLGKVSFLIIPLLAFIFGFMVYNILLFYPSFEARLRGRKIDIVLPHAVALMHALSRGSSDIISFFEVIGENKNIYGEVSKEAKGTLVDTRICKLDLKTALKNSATTTPSESYKNFIESLSTIITSGGNLVAFFLTKSEQYRQKALDENKAFMDTLGLFSEIYVTGLAAGPLFIIVLLVVLGLIGGSKYVLLLSIVYLLIPGGSLLFVILLSSLAEGTGSNSIIRMQDDPGNLIKNPGIKKAAIRMQIYGFFKDPLRNLTEVPEKVLYFSVPFGLIFFILSTHNYYGLELNELIYFIDDFIIFAAVIILVPYALLVEAHFRRLDRISRNFPEFLNRLASLHESGLSLISSLKRLGSSDLGILNREIKKMNIDIELSGSIVEAFRNFGKRINTITVRRVVVLIENASRITGNIKDSLVIAASDATTSKTMEDERKRYTQMHVVILYISFFVFLYVIWSLVTEFLPQLPDIPADATSELVGQGIAFSGIDKPLYVRLFFHASILEGFFSGLVAGQISEGDVRLGLKHGLIMTVIAYILFMFV